MIYVVYNWMTGYQKPVNIELKSQLFEWTADDGTAKSEVLPYIELNTMEELDKFMKDTGMSIMIRPTKRPFQHLYVDSGRFNQR